LFRTTAVRLAGIQLAIGSAPSLDDRLKAVQLRVRLEQEHGLGRAGDFLHLRLGAAMVRPTIDQFCKGAMLIFVRLF